MAIEAPVSRFRKNNLKIYIAACVFAAGVFAYDGYLSKYEWSGRGGFYKENVVDGEASATMKFNQKSPPIFLIVAVIFGIKLFRLKSKKLIAAENELIVNGTEHIGYDSIEKIDKTHFETKDFFVIGYKDQSQKEAELKLSGKMYDNLPEVLSLLVEKIS